MDLKEYYMLIHAKAVQIKLGWVKIKRLEKL